MPGSDDGDDWFERALADDTAGSDGDRGGGGDDSDVRGGSDADADADENAGRNSAFEFGGDGPPRSDAESAPGSDADADATPGGEPFAEDFATAFENAPAVGGGGSGGGGGVDAGGHGAGGELGEVLGTSGDFDEGSFESSLERVDVGIRGLDEMILGGVPRRSMMVAVGSPGTGKTTLGLQFLHHALREGGRGVYITLEETRRRILDTAAEKGWPFDEYEAEGRLAVVDLDPVEMANSLGSIQDDLPRLIREFDADRLVLDSVSLLEMMYDEPSVRRTEVYEFTDALKEAGVTAMLTSEADGDNPYTSRYGIVEYLADAVFVLQYVRGSDSRETRLAVEIQKVRDANHSRETKPYEITDEGISVYGQANLF